MNPTPEQQAALGMFLSGESLAIEAGAGTGKTSTLRMLAEHTSKHGQYVAFNRAIVDEARSKFPLNVDCSTAHSLAFRAVGKRYAHRLNGSRLPSYKTARLLGLDSPVMIRLPERVKVLQPGYLASLVMRGISNFCFSADEEPEAKHLPYVEGIDPPTGDGTRSWRNNDALRRELTPALARAWADLQNPDGRLRFGHDHYLKAWQLSRPVLPADFVLFDEAQDAAPVMLAAIAAQTHAQLVFVGDSQQQIYEWRGAVNALARVEVHGRTYLTQSWRFGPEVASIANLVLAELDAELRLTGTDSIPSRVRQVHDPDAILCRSNAAAVSTVLNLQQAGKRPHLVGGGQEIVAFAKAAAALMDGERTWHAELACFETWREVQDYVDQDPLGGELKLLVGLVDEYGVDTILQALDGMVAEEHADLVVSTAHKSKGREWAKVKLAGDFQLPDEGPGGAGEWRLLYVAATRAREALDIGACGPLLGLLNREPAPVEDVVLS